MKYHIKHGDNKYICNAIVNIRCGNENQKQKLIDWIKSQLNGQLRLENWLLQEGYVNDTDCFYNEIEKQKLLNTRLNWIDNLIEICKKDEENVQRN